MAQTINFKATMLATARAISQAHGVPVAQVLADLQAGLDQRGVQKFSGLRRPRSRGVYGDISSDISTIVPDSSTAGLFAAPEIALYAFGAVILGLGLFVALKRKKTQ